MSISLCPAQRALLATEAYNQRVGHENAGFLSAERGFVPVQAPRTQLSAAFAAWDEIAAELPSLFAELTLRRRVEALPLLDASPQALDDGDLLRASALLGIVSHAYWYMESDPPPALPPALSRPWAQVRARLGRRDEVLSYVDLIVYNWRAREGYAGRELTLEHLDLLLPTVGNQEERVFYLTQLEILARASPLPALLAEAQAAAVRADPDALERALARITTVFAHSASALALIDPRARARTYVDPVRWAKTVAPLAVPFQRGVLGPSGTSSPLFNTLDAFFGRTQFDSALGREIRALRGTYPPAWRLFVRALDAFSVGDFVASCKKPSLRAAWEHALAEYSGSQGFLARHRRKVYGYLEIAFKVGRSLTIGGFGGAFVDRTWNEVDAALASSHAERPRAQPQLAPCPAAGAHARSIDVSEIAAHNTAARGYWVVVDGAVCDLTRLIDSHPGGSSVLRAYAGLDATAGFARAHGTSERARVMRDALQIGVVRRPDLGGDCALEAAYRVAVAALYLVVEMQNAHALDRSFALDPACSQERRTPYERMRAGERQHRFLAEYVDVFETRTLPALWSAASLALFPEQHGALSELLLRTAAGSGELAARQDEGTRDAIDARLLVELKAALTAVVRAFEAYGPRLRRSGALRVRRSCLRCVAALQRYQLKVLPESSECPGQRPCATSRRGAYRRA